MLVRIGRIVLGRNVVAEDDVCERLEAVGVMTRHVDGDRVVLTDVGAENLTARAVEHDDASGAEEASEEVVLAALVVMEATNHALTREGDIRLHSRFSHPALAPHLEKPPALIASVRERNELEPLDHRLAP
jgi:hypothetical protein